MRPEILTYARFVGIALCIGAVATYAFLQFQTYLTGPTLSIASPINGATVPDESVTITGSAHNIAYLSLNGAEIYTNPDGEFSEQLLVPTGYTIMQLTGTDRFGRTETETLEIVRN